MLNSVSLIGHIGSDIEIRRTEADVPYTRIPLAINHYWSKNGERQQETSWVKCLFWSNKAAVLADYARKGDKIGVVGRLHQNKWEKDGKQHQELIVVVEELELLGRNGNTDPELTDPQDIPF